MMDQVLFNSIGTALFGTSWHGDMSRQLGVNLRTIERWSKGQSKISPGVWGDLIRLLDVRRAELDDLRPRLKDRAFTSTSE